MLNMTPTRWSLGVHTNVINSLCICNDVRRLLKNLFPESGKINKIFETKYAS